MTYTEVNLMIFDEMPHDEEYHMMDWWIGVFGPTWWIFMVLWWVLFFIVAIIMAYFVHKDALKRKIPNPEVWLLIVLIFNVIGLLIYLLVRENYREVNTKE